MSWITRILIDGEGEKNGTTLDRRRGDAGEVRIARDLEKDPRVDHPLDRSLERLWNASGTPTLTSTNAHVVVDDAHIFNTLGDVGFHLAHKLWARLFHGVVGNVLMDREVVIVGWSR